MAAVRQLVVNADDFGFTRDVNAGIIEAHNRGILTATTLMANGEAFDDAVRLARAHPTLDVGVHLVMVQGPSLARPGNSLPESVPQLIRDLVWKRVDPYTELRPQIEKVLEAGIRPLHLDTHKHTHLWPSVLDAVTRLSQEYGIPWVRRPFDLPLVAGEVPWSKRAISQALASTRAQFQRRLTARGCRTTDHFAGFQITGRYRAAELAALIRGLPEGVTEFMCHPGLLGNELRRASTRLKESRVMELEALVSDEVRRAVSESDVRLVRFGFL